MGIFQEAEAQLEGSTIDSGSWAKLLVDKIYEEYLKDTQDKKPEDILAVCISTISSMTGGPMGVADRQIASIMSVALGVKYPELAAPIIRDSEETPISALVSLVDDIVAEYKKLNV